MRRMALVVPLAAFLVIAAMSPALGKNPKKDPAQLILTKLTDGPDVFDGLGNQNGGKGFSKEQFERFSCTSAGDPSGVVDMSCNASEWGQDFSPDNEIAIAVDPADPEHLLAGSNDYTYRFNNRTGAR